MEDFFLQCLSNLCIVAAIVAIYLCLPISGLRLKSTGLIFVVLYALASAAVMAVLIYFGALSLYMAFWMALGGGANSAHIFMQAIALIFAACAITVNYIALVSSTKVFSTAVEMSSKPALLLTSILIVATQLSSPLVFKEFSLFRTRKPQLAFGYIDKTGQFVIRPAYGDAEKFHDGLAVVTPQECPPAFESDTKTPITYTQIDRAGKRIKTLTEQEHASIIDYYKTLNPEDVPERKIEGAVPPSFAGQYGEDLTVVRMDGKSGYADRDGKIVLPCIYEDARLFADGLAAVKVWDKWGYVDHRGKIVIEPAYARALPFSNGLAAVAMDNLSPDPRYGDTHNDRRLYGFIDKTGEYVLPPVYLYAYSFSEGLAAVRVELGNLPQLSQARNNLNALRQQQIRDSEAANKNLIALCLQAWRNSAAWQETSQKAPIWLDKINKQLEKSPEDSRLLSYQAVFYTGIYPPDLKAAQASAVHALRVDQQNTLAHGVLAHCYSLKQQNKLALPEASRAIALDNKNPEWYALRGLILEDMNLNKEAAKDYSEEIKLRPESAWAYGSRAHARLAVEDREGAIKDSDSALSIDSTNVFAYKQKADALSRQGKFDIALEQLSIAQSYLNPESGEMLELLEMRASILGFKGDHKNSELVKKQAIELKKKLYN